MTVVHRNLTGADLHEPKGADTALSGQVYVANGSGGGVWTDASTIITNTAFTTGDVKYTYKTTADSSWILMDDGTIGDGSSVATTRANADTSALFTLLWNNTTNANCAVSGGRGASAAADFAAHKTIALPKVLGRSPMVAGSGSSLTTRTLAQIYGQEIITLVTAHLPPYTPTGTIAINNIGNVGIANAGSTQAGGAAQSFTSTTVNPTGTFTGTPQGGTSSPFQITHAVHGINVMMKL